MTIKGKRDQIDKTSQIKTRKDSHKTRQDNHKTRQENRKTRHGTTPQDKHTTRHDTTRYDTTRQDRDKIRQNMTH